MHVAEQMALFDRQVGLMADKPEIEPALMEWSYTRRDVLERCPRWYYYQYYGASSRVAKAESQKEVLRFLKTLRNQHQRAGEIAHLIIRTYLTRLRQGEAWSLERVLRWAQDIYRRDLEYSRQYQHSDPSSDSTNPPVLFLEFYYGFKQAEALWAESEARLLMALTNFVTSPELAQFRAGGSKAEALVEKQIRLREAHFSLRGQLDLAYPDNGRVMVVDWKIGDANGSDGSLQLLSYALGAMQEFKCAPDSIDFYRVHLADNKVSPFIVCEKEILRAKARIIQDLERMQALNGYGRQAVAEAFTPCGQPRICALCSFQGICPKE